MLMPLMDPAMPPMLLSALIDGADEDGWGERPSPSPGPILLSKSQLFPCTLSSSWSSAAVDLRCNTSLVKEARESRFAPGNVDRPKLNPDDFSWRWALLCCCCCSEAVELLLFPKLVFVLGIAAPPPSFFFLGGCFFAGLLARGTLPDPRPRSLIPDRDRSEVSSSVSESKLRSSSLSLVEAVEEAHELSSASFDRFGCWLSFGFALLALSWFLFLRD